MPVKAQNFVRPDVADRLLTADLPDHAEGWFLDSQSRGLSSATISAQRNAVARLEWFLQDRSLQSYSTTELRQFFTYLQQHHEAGRWGNQALAGVRGQLRPASVFTYFKILRTFFNFLTADGVIGSSPLRNIRTPIYRQDELQCFSEADVLALVAAVRKSRHPRRDEVIVRILFDTGLRASELCGITRSDLDISSRQITVLGKGNKWRCVYFGDTTARAIWSYLRAEPKDTNEPVFQCDRGVGSGNRLTRSGLTQLLRRLGKAAGIETARCSPHTARHFFAVQYLRNGGDVFSLKAILGHTSLTIVNAYVQFAESDIRNKQRLYSPMDRLGPKGRRSE